ncbi:MAG: hypothetical protein Q8S29_16070 [Phreatobacter sp.]|nr:hypothetical protein [Phreatobacter sp.]
MDDPDQTAPVPRDDGGTPPKPPSRRERHEMATGNQRAAAPKAARDGKAIAVEDLDASNDK